jgi:hypothetical protein
MEFEKWRETEAALAVRIGAALSGDPSLAHLWRASNLALDVLFRSCAQESPGEPCGHTDDQHTLMFLGGRVLTDTLAAVRLLLGGYYLQAMILQRDVLESGFLLQLFNEHPNKIAAWRTANAKERMKSFSIGGISKKLKASDVWNRYEEYTEYCELAAHPTAVGRVLTYRSDIRRATVGPFFEERTAKKVLLHIAINVCDACHNLLHAIGGHGSFDHEWQEIEKCFDEWNAVGPIDDPPLEYT